MNYALIHPKKNACLYVFSIPSRLVIKMQFVKDKSTENVAGAKQKNLPVVFQIQVPKIRMKEHSAVELQELPAPKDILVNQTETFLTQVGSVLRSFPFDDLFNRFDDVFCFHSPFF